MFGKLSRITQAISLAENQQQVLELIVGKVCSELNVEVCSIFLADHDISQLVLMATKGLNPESVGRTRVAFNEGLVGLVGHREAPVHLSSANLHPAFYYVKDIGEDEYSAYLGVPIIHQRKVLGVLSIQQKEARQFELDEEAFLITLAAQAASVLANRETDAIIEDDRRNRLVRCINGIAVTSGVAVGIAKVVFPSHDIANIPNRKSKNTCAQIKTLRKAVKRTHRQLEQMSNRMKGLISDQERSLFQAYQQILGSEGIEKEVAEQINAGFWAPSALKIVISKHIKAFRSMEDPYLRERASDIEDLANRLLSNMMATDPLKIDMQAGSILVAETITASLLAEIPLHHVIAVVSLKGSSTSHAAILTKALGIPTIMGLDPCKIDRLDGKTLVVDAYNGQLFVSPDAQLIQQYEALVKEEKRFAKELEKEQSALNLTKDGTPIAVFMNASSAKDVKEKQKFLLQGIGLYRSEVPFLQHPRFPSEETQVEIYREILQNFATLPVTIRTLDVGGDKQLPYFNIDEDNPFLGWRGVRVTLDHPEIFLVQLRALLKASAGLNNLKIALPMVSTIEELKECHRLIYQAFCEIQTELLTQNIELVRPKIGLILEVPSAVFQLSSFIKRVDFISVGSNDLIQYLMAVDRNNLRLKNLYSHFQPAVLKMLKQIVLACENSSVSLQICGEMASDPMAAILLIGLGYRELSMSVSSIAKVKRAFSRFTVIEMQQLAEKVLGYETEAKIKNELFSAINSRGLSGLIRAGN